MEKRFKIFMVSGIFMSVGVILMGLFSFIGSVSGGLDYLSYASYAFAMQLIFSIISLGFLVQAAFGKDDAKNKKSKA
jgi:hypothetical protein